MSFYKIIDTQEGQRGGSPILSQKKTSTYRCREHNNCYKHHDIGIKTLNRSLWAMTELARESALCSPYEHKHGAVLFSRGKVLATGYNHTNRRACGATLFGMHAETDCMRNFIRKVKKRIYTMKDLRGARLLVTRVTKHGLAYSAPCWACQQKFLKWHRNFGVTAMLFT